MFFNTGKGRIINCNFITDIVEVGGDKASVRLSGSNENILVEGEVKQRLYSLLQSYGAFEKTLENVNE